MQETTWLKEETEAIARQRILAAAEAVFRRRGIAKARMHQIAAEAGCSRVTLYRYFDGKDAVVFGVMLDQAQRFVAGLRAHLDGVADPGEAIVEAALYALREIPAHPQLAMFFDNEGFGVTRRFVARPGLVFDLAAGVLHPLLQRAHDAGRLRDGLDFDEATEWTVRSIFSFLSLESPNPRDEAQLGDYLRRFLLPVLLDA